ncbi:MAG: glutaminyl-peptide cyclotransferase [Polaribacter sp.]
MTSFRFYFIALILLILSSCETAYKLKIDGPKKISYGESLQFEVKEENNQSIDSVSFYINGKEMKSEGAKIQLDSKSVGIGKHALSAVTFYPGKAKTLNWSFEILANQAPSVYTYKVINTYPHDTKAYTQGLEYYKGYLYETTGRKGQSYLRKVDIKTGKVLQQYDLDKAYFGEGMTIFNDTIYWLTWQAKKGFVFDLKSFKKIKEFDYNQSKEGWGLTHNDSELIKSDGTSKVWFLDPSTQKEKRFIQVYTNKYGLNDLNELELIGDQLYANKYQQNAVVIIDVNTGMVTGVANLTGLKEEVEKTQKLVPEDEVLNGIAYDKENNRLFVTGKNWNTLFEIELIKKQ